MRCSFVYGCQIVGRFQHFYLPCLTERTWLCLDEFYEFSAHEIFQRITDGHIHRIGVLPEAITLELPSCAISCERRARSSIGTATLRACSANSSVRRLIIDAPKKTVCGTWAAGRGRDERGRVMLAVNELVIASARRSRAVRRRQAQPRPMPRLGLDNAPIPACRSGRDALRPGHRQNAGYAPRRRQRPAGSPR
jgi:hypothetical protein